MQSVFIIYYLAAKKSDRDNSCRRAILSTPSPFPVQPVLSSDETKAIPDFEKERLQPTNKPFLQVPFLHFPVDTKEFEVVGTLQHLICLLGKMLRQGEREIVRLLLLDSSVICTGFNLVEQYISRPTKTGSSPQVVESGSRVSEFCQHISMMSPRHLSNQNSHSL
jgi:hypothetical protein